jgi:hypothetical protein
VVEVDLLRLSATPAGHKAKGTNISTPAKSTATARVVAEVQRRLPKARVVYVSATGASEIQHLAYMSRLGLWGPGTAFENAADFTKSVKGNGTGALELVAMDLKGRGIFLARSLSFRGADFSTEYVPLSESFMKMYDGCVDIWRDMYVLIVFFFSDFACNDGGCGSACRGSSGGGRGRIGGCCYHRSGGCYSDRGGSVPVIVVVVVPVTVVVVAVVNVVVGVVVKTIHPKMLLPGLLFRVLWS